MQDDSTSIVKTSEATPILQQKIAIMGFGNPCRSDDAIGIYVIEQLQKQISVQQNISLLDMGTGAFEILFKLKGHHKIIIIDAVVNTGEAPGTLYKVPASQLEAAIVDDPMVFLHSLKWDQALSYTKKIMQDEYPEDIQVYLIAVDDTKLEIELSNIVKEAGDKVVTLIKEELAKWT
ncbi:MAG TPA: hydrogenase maturation protease [Arachidicoccus sp.]